MFRDDFFGFYFYFDPSLECTHCEHAVTVANEVDYLEGKIHLCIILFRLGSWWFFLGITFTTDGRPVPRFTFTSSKAGGILDLPQGWSDNLYSGRLLRLTSEKIATAFRRERSMA